VGFKDGDKIIAVGGKRVERFNDVMKEFIFQQANTFDVQRDDKVVKINIPQGTIRQIIQSRKKGSFIGIRTPYLVGKVNKGSSADKMGLIKGDSIIALNNQPVTFFDQFEEIKQIYKGQNVTLTVLRKNQIAQLHGLLPSDGIFGFAPDIDPARYFLLNTIKYGFLASIGKGFSTTFETFGSYWEQFRFLFTSKEVKASESLGGIVSFGQMFPPVFSWETFLHLTAFVSIILAFMNLLPIPGLDGGYVLFLIFELISGRKVNDKVMERATTVGLVLLLGLMLYANGLDIFRLFKK